MILCPERGDQEGLPLKLNLVRGFYDKSEIRKKDFKLNGNR
jgi:hypothetical protein